MKRPTELRASPTEWIEILKAAYPFLVSKGVGNPILFGSQAMSFYMKHPLRSKDLDLVTDQIGPKVFEDLTSHLKSTRPANAEFRTTTIQTIPFDERMTTVYSVEMQILKRPFILEIFNAVLDGRPPSILSQYLQQGNKWGANVWVPSRDAIVALRLCFRPPQGISRLNATRLNSFIRDNKTKIHHRKVGEIVVSWGKADLVRTNLEQLRKQYSQKITDQEKFLAAIEAAEKKAFRTS
jgi:hypothetical protein